MEVKEFPIPIKDDVSSSGSPSRKSLDGGINRGLFEYVIERARTQAYDTDIGQYVHKDTLLSDGDNSHNRFKTEFNYIKLMETQRKEMKKVVHQFIIERDYHHEPYIPHKADVPRLPCFICGLLAPEPELLGKITFAGAIKWKEAHGVMTPLSDHRLNSNDKYDVVKLCVFCTQFFDADFSDVTACVLDEQKSVFKDSPLRKKLLKPTVRRKILVADPSELDRPISRMKLKLEVQRIKDQAMNDPAYRYQYNSAAPSGKLDQQKAGYFLRKKYFDVRIFDDHTRILYLYTSYLLVIIRMELSKLFVKNDFV